MIALILLLVSSSYFASANEYYLNIENECPDQENIPKCNCIVMEGETRVTCNQFDTDEELRDHLKELKGYVLYMLQISRYNTLTVPTDLFNGLEIKYLYLQNVEEEDASFTKDNNHFQGLEESLKLLEISRSFRKKRPLLNLQINHLKNLEEITLTDNNIPEVGNDWFPSGHEKLHTVIFDRNSIEKFGDQAFSSLSNLKSLAVTGNYLSTLSRSMLPKTAHRLTFLDFADNKISTLSPDIFSGMPSLEAVFLDNNLLSVIDQDTWSPVFSQLVTLELQGNILKCDEKLKWICSTEMPNDIQGDCDSPEEKKGRLLKQFCKQ